MKVMICPQCGASLSLDESREFGFCSFCGSKVQINEFVIHKHVGRIGVDGLATAKSITLKGFMDLAQGDYTKAKSAFEKAQEIDPLNPMVLLGLASATLHPNKYIMNQLVSQCATISEGEKSAINSETAHFFARTYLYYDKPSRFKYVVQKYNVPIDFRLLDDDRQTNSEYMSTVLKPNRKIDLIKLYLGSGISIDEIGAELFRKSLSGTLEANSKRTIMLSEKTFSLELFGRLLEEGFNTDALIKYSVYEERFAFLLESKVKNNNSYVELLYKYHPSQKKKGCYIATAVYGSYNCPQVWTLRRYRDDFLAKKWYGRAFIKLYYAISPVMVKWFGETLWFKKLFKSKIDRMVIALHENGIEDTPYVDKEW